MSIFYEQYYNTGIGDTPHAYGGEELGFFEAMSSAYNSQVRGSNIDTYVELMKEELQPVIDSIQEKEGQTFINPANYFGASDSLGNSDDARERSLGTLFDHLNANRELYPEFESLTRDSLHEKITSTALEEIQAGRESAERETTLGGVGGFVGIAGGVFSDDAFLEQLFMMGPTAFTRSSANLGQTMVREAIIGAGMEAQLQAGVMDWYNSLGLDYGYDQFLTNVAAGLFIGGALPPVLKGGSTAVSLSFDQAKRGIEAFKGTSIKPKDGDLAMDQLDDLEALSSPDAPEVFAAPEGSDASVANLVEALNRNADDAELVTNPAVVKAQSDMSSIPETVKQEGFDTVEWDLNRTFNDPITGETFTGYETALKKLYDGAKTLGWTDAKLAVPDAPNKFDKRAIIVLGPPASGKSSIANPIARKHGAAIIDADEAKKLLPEFHNGAGANAVHKESKELAEVLQVQAIDDGLNVVIPTVGSKPEVIRKLIKKFKDSGYNVDLVGMDVSYTNARNRMLMRFVGEGRYIPLDYIQSIGNKPLEVYNVLRKEGLADGFTQIDNNGKFGDAKPVLEDTRGLLEGVELRLREGRRGSDGAAQDATRSREVQSPEANAQEEFIGRLNKADDAFANLERGNLPDDPVGSTQTRPAPQETAIQAKDVDDAVEQVSRDTDFENMPDDEILVLDEVIDDQVVARSYTGAEIKAELAQDQQMLDRLRGCVV
jgi:predicted ABC-type ATPase